MKPENVKCPDCDGPMVSRQNKRDGSRFWGCAAYPKCRGTRNVDGEINQPRCQLQFTRDDGEAEDGSPSDRWRNRDRSRW